jgi:NAD-dependent deacetylase
MARSAHDQFAALVAGAQRIAVLTGAGISTPSGIPDFRSSTGLYSDSRNTGVFDIAEFRRNPAFFYRFAQEFYPLVANAQPNAAHRALAEWERAGKDVQIATQNIDDLHQRAGSTRVYPVHGTVQTSTCQDCGRACATRMIEAHIVVGRLPHCDCGGVYKPDITFFGEPLPETAWEASVRAMAEAELVLVIGTSLVVHPAALLPDYRAPDAKLAIVNRDPTPLDAAADVVLHDELTAVLAAVR